MGGIASLSERVIIQRLKSEGWVRKCGKGGHDQWYNDRYPHRRVTTAPASMGSNGNNVKRSVFRQAGWQWTDKDGRTLKEVHDENKILLKENTELRTENESLRKSLYDMIKMVDVLTDPQQQNVG